MLAEFLGTRDVLFISHVAYGDHRTARSLLGFDPTKITDASRDRPFVHMQSASCVDAYVLAILGANLSRGNHFELMESGGAREMKEERTRQVNAGELNADVFLRCKRLRMFVHMDAAKAKGLPAAWGKSITVFKVRVAGMKSGVCQLRFSPFLRVG